MLARTAGLCPLVPALPCLPLGKTAPMQVLVGVPAGVALLSWQPTCKGSGSSAPSLAWGQLPHLTGAGIPVAWHAISAACLCPPRKALCDSSWLCCLLQSVSPDNTQGLAHRVEAVSLPSSVLQLPSKPAGSPQCTMLLTTLLPKIQKLKIAIESLT